MVFRRDSNDTVTTLGVSGLLYKRDLLLYNPAEQIPLVSSHGTSSQRPAQMRTPGFCAHRTHHLGILEKAESGNKHSLTRRRLRTWLFTFAIRGLRRKWRHLFSCILPKQLVSSQRAGYWNKYQWPLQSPSFSENISGKITTWRLGGWPKTFSWI